jgi:aminomethyltransferase
VAEAPDQTAPLKTPLDTWHRAHGARMVGFAGYAMPVQYDLTDELAQRCRGGVMAEHLHTRSQAGLFDVSHMGQAMLTGAGVTAALERLVPGAFTELKPGRQRYTLLTNEVGGIIDDLMVARISDDRLFVVVNAARKDVDFTHIGTHLPDGVTLTPLPDRALLALQGPAAAAVMERLCPEAAALPVMGFGSVTVAGPLRLHRRGWVRNLGSRGAGGSTGRPADRRDRGRADRPGRAGFAPPGGRALPVRQRH